jgi:nucleoside-diphosphate-sugar epimerase
MTVLITGAEGFIGRNLAEALLRRGAPVLAPSRAELDLADCDAVDRYFGAHRIDAVVHSATTLREVTSYPPDTCENNLRMFFNLQRQLTPAMRMIALGSGSEYARKHWRRKMPEDFFERHVPDDAHSYSKYLIAKYIRDAKSENLLCLRIFGIYGRHEDYRYKFISNAIVKNILGMPIVINQNVVYDYLYVDDFVRMIEHFLANPWRHRILNATPTASIDLVAIAETVNAVSRRPSEIRVLNGGIGVEYSGDNALFLSEAPGFAFTPPETAIGELYRHYLGLEAELDAESVKRDAFLEYAKTLQSKYFGEKHEK